MIGGLDALLNVSEEEKEARGIRYTPHEIIQQPASWRKTFQIVQEQQSDLRQFLLESGFDLRKPSGNPTVFLIGAGTSDYVGRALTYLLRRMWGCEVWAVPSTELLTNLEDLVFSEPKHLWISFSRSGDSSEGLAVLEAAIERYAGQCLAHLYSLSSYEETFSVLCDAGERFLKRVQEIAPLIAQEEFSKACFIGSGALHAAAQESALKLLEMTAGKIQSMSESTLGLRHGPMSALDRNTLFVSYLSRDKRRLSYELDLLEEINRKQLGKLRAVVSPDATDHLGHLVDNVFSLHAPNLRDEYRPPVDVMLAQSLGLFSSLKLGLQPDCPSPNGAISRVVSHVNIYR